MTVSVSLPFRCSMPAAPFVAFATAGASPLRQVARCHKPMLFIHGDRDTFVPFSMLARLYAAKPQPKAQWVSPGSIHARSFHDHPVAYAAHVRSFVGQYISLGDSLK